MMSADGVPYHKQCFKCSHCNGRLAISNYSAVDGQLYCKPHFEQLFKETGSFTTRKFQSCEYTYSELMQNRAPSRVSSFFSGTLDKCSVCTKTVYPLEKVTMEGEFYHKSCFRCAHGGCFLTTSSYAALDGILYCKPHFAQLFKEKGSYAHLTKTTSGKKNIAALDNTNTNTNTSNNNTNNTTNPTSENNEPENTTPEVIQEA
ncbi:lim domain-containing protein plim2c [Phtheirospermum japonicum]|uniref:Lim domain-containing protein plim2c n=1 Tax=Phtheirospermum japonicum TaxID=374723 RepID=A0A830BMP9_9LAMI|nr:lim domain-containing protein plim2c [Phtheirospermum japonicum]